MSFRDMMSSREAQKEYGAPSSFCKNGNLLVRGEDGSFHKSSFEKGKQTRLNRRYLGERNGREPYPYPGYTSLDWNPEPDPMVIDDDILKQAITGYLSDPDIRRALTDMVDAAKKKKMTITTTDLESDAPNMEGYVSEETINPLAEAREELANVGIDDDDKFKMQIARNNLTERGFNSSEAENMTGRAMNDKRDLTHTHHDERKPDMMDGRFLAGYGPNTKSPKPTKPFAEEHPELVSS